MARGRASACLSVAVWVCCVSVCVAGAKSKSLDHTNSQTSDRSSGASVTSDGGNVTVQTSTLPPSAATKRQKPLLTTDSGINNQQEAEKPQGKGGTSAANNSGGKQAHVREVTHNSNKSGHGSSSSVPAAIRDLSSSHTADQLRSATSLAGTLVLLLISVVIAGALFVMVICFIHKWKENMGTG